MRQLLVIFCLATSLGASPGNKSFVMSTTEPIIAGNKLLKPGNYIWRLVDSSSNRNIVQISDQETGQVETTIHAINNYRAEVTGENQLQYWETPKGMPQAVRAWFYPGDNYGQEFPYPTELMTTLVAETAVAKPPVEQARVAPTQLAETPMIHNRRRVDTTAHLALARTLAQRSPAAQGSWARVTDGAAPPSNHHTIWDALSKLPLTATLAPLIGLIGLASLILYLVSYSKRRRLSL